MIELLKEYSKYYLESIYAQIPGDTLNQYIQGPASDLPSTSALPLLRGDSLLFVFDLSSTVINTYTYGGNLPTYVAGQGIWNIDPVNLDPMPKHDISANVPHDASGNSYFYDLKGFPEPTNMKIPEYKWGDGYRFAFKIQMGTPAPRGEPPTFPVGGLNGLTVKDWKMSDIDPYYEDPDNFKDPLIGTTLYPASTSTTTINLTTLPPTTSTSTFVVPNTTLP
jgi:hypothetical protein